MMIHLNLQSCICLVFPSLPIGQSELHFFLAIPMKVIQITGELLSNPFPKQQTLETLMFEKPWAGSGNRLQNSPLNLGSITREIMPHIFSVVL